ncbi:MAG: hypothetical protein LBE30_05705 [Comamonas sp.]|nr:hypothetical protein [Comamonas sp.]
MIAEIEGAMRASLHLSVATSAAYDALHIHLHGDHETVPPVLVPWPQDVQVLRDVWDRRWDALMMFESERHHAVRNLLLQLESGQRKGLRGLGGLRMSLYNVECFAWLESNAWQALCAASEAHADLAILCQEFAKLRMAESEADARMVDGVRRLLLVLPSVVATSQSASVR